MRSRNRSDGLDFGLAKALTHAHTASLVACLNFARTIKTFYGR
jgi:hypothetical protein